MKLKSREILRISRPRFWMYVLGTFLVGMIASGNPFNYELIVVINLIAFSIFFTLPANLFIYGVNDIYDYQTDIHNEKKVKYEETLPQEKHKKLWLLIGVLLMPLLPFFFTISLPALIAIIVFLFTGFFYSAGPIRAKSKPPLDILFSSIIYVSPALIGFYLTGRTDIDWLTIAGGLIWASAMQTYSAVPDMEADEKAGISTLATKLGKNNALLFCLIAYIVSAAIGYFYLGYIASIFGLVYAILVILSLINSSKLFKYYTYFPLINVLTGAVLFFYLFFSIFK